MLSVDHLGYKRHDLPEIEFFVGDDLSSSSSVGKWILGREREGEGEREGEESGDGDEVVVAPLSRLIYKFCFFVYFFICFLFLSFLTLYPHNVFFLFSLDYLKSNDVVF